MPEKRLTAYELGQEWSALVSLINDLTDPETGETRELTEEVKQRKIKTELFTVYYQETKKSAKPVDSIFNADLIPAEFLKRELSPSAINKAIEEGRLYEKNDNPLDRGKLFDRDRGGEALKGVFYGGGETLVIR